MTEYTWRQELLATNPARRLERRKPARRGDRAIPAARLDKLFTDPPPALRERPLWRLLYDTAARAKEILSLNVEDLDLEFRHARVVSKGGAIEYVHWATATARLLPRLLAGRTARGGRCISSTPAGLVPLAFWTTHWLRQRRFSAVLSEAFTVSILPSARVMVVASNARTAAGTPSTVTDSQS